MEEQWIFNLWAASSNLTGRIEEYDMAKEFAQGFYKSKAWQRCRAAYVASVGGLCERCLRDGIVTAGEIVHHKIRVTPDTINDPQVLLDWGNLELLCRECHHKVHDGEIHKPADRTKRRFSVGEDGEITAE